MPVYLYTEFLSSQLSSLSVSACTRIKYTLCIQYPYRRDPVLALERPPKTAQWGNVARGRFKNERWRYSSVDFIER